MATALASLMSMKTVPLAAGPSPIQPMPRLQAALGPSCPKLFVKRDDLLTFACGGNKVRKMEAVAAEAAAAHADTLITCGGMQSNHARVTAAVGACLGLRVVLVLNGHSTGAGPTHPERLTGNVLLDTIFGADIRYVPDRADRAPAMDAAADELRARGRRPFIVPLGASTATGALGFARGLAEVGTAVLKPTVIVHASSSAGTQAGMIAGAALLGMRARVVGISADAASKDLQADVRRLLGQMAERLGATPATIGADQEIEVDDRFVGEGYGLPTDASREALSLAARCEGMVLDPVYTAKAMAGLIGRIRAGEMRQDESVLFWHTGGVPGLFA